MWIAGLAVIAATTHEYLLFKRRTPAPAGERTFGKRNRRGLRLENVMKAVQALLSTFLLAITTVTFSFAQHDERDSILVYSVTNSTAQADILAEPLLWTIAAELERSGRFDVMPDRQLPVPPQPGGRQSSDDIAADPRVRNSAANLLAMCEIKFVRERVVRAARTLSVGVVVRVSLCPSGWMLSGVAEIAETSRPIKAGPYSVRDIQCLIDEATRGGVSKAIRELRPTGNIESILTNGRVEVGFRMVVKSTSPRSAAVLRGHDLVGRVRIEPMNSVLASANITEGAGKIQPGDIVRLLFDVGGCGPWNTGQVCDSSECAPMDQPQLIDIWN